ncbi:MAG TPA: pantoate--beta-alanine ligase [Solirubrobacteraceae bacterium]|jgi:pantoate--beta-alanine ligase
MSHHIPTMRTARELREALESSRQARQSIALVPTMGALHEGHLSLIRQARERCDVVVVSIFVNPSQFDRGADLERYPRQEVHDVELAAQAGADLVFAPSVEEVYPAGFATQVQVLGITDRLEGASRGPEHFRGVATVVAKLLNIVQPEVAFFGQKDAQQVLVIRRLVADLNLPVSIAVGPTVREADGLALSSRNAQLGPQERERALALYAGLRAAAEVAMDGELAADALLSAAHSTMVLFEVEPEYLSLVDPDSLEELSRLDGPALLAVAAHVGSVRLIDNVILDPSNLAAAAPLPLPSPRKVTACSV